MHEELRNHTRFKLKRRAFVGLIGPKSDIIFQLGQIIDISYGGVGLCYIPPHNGGDEVTHISIFGRADTLIMIEKVSCKVVFDMSVPTKSWINLPEIRCGIEFLKPSSTQKKQIENFIRDFGINPHAEHTH
jgi:hypothetical protein